MTMYDSRFCQLLKDHCGAGRSLESFCATPAICVSPKIMTEWYHQYEDFRDAVELAPCLELMYWEMYLGVALAHKDKEAIYVSKSRIDHLMRHITSPITKNTFNDLKEAPEKKKTSTSGDLVRDLYLLKDKRT